MRLGVGFRDDVFAQAQHDIFVGAKGVSQRLDSLGVDGLKAFNQVQNAVEFVLSARALFRAELNSG